MTDSHDNPSESIPPGATASTDPERSVEEQRADLADTVAALAAKADVPARVQDSANAQLHEAKAFAKENPQILTAVSLGIALVALIIFRRKRSHRRSDR
ncbi:DUF3618 domain-containing protein [Rhodococcus erythropolis]|jgi:hypothetical protein|uniref:DUF3618 domain-containing protein n=2 Tax=Actinomycetes TaxID=1760 RepID=A0ABV5XKC9_9NOCA|nr:MULTISPECIES: DUF3618 domain-containing protein [Rhodococcus]AZI65989.1 DUF3618 domain-containing protein [Rhodococcus sp. NJ-530]NHP18547.1 DUF3618 domain-containing protein [Rhodococcus sp. IC4_135]REK75277.1 DUF3618 domain-containing protein [Rhodococcus erythropolis]MBP1054620.1 DUF3618 domain-containing protein [Rhodococcus qingshengii]QEM25454.1 DUF3618 domain-containing protein [Rhodococcus qingshengii]